MKNESRSCARLAMLGLNFRFIGIQTVDHYTHNRQKRNETKNHLSTSTKRRLVSLNKKAITYPEAPTSQLLSILLSRKFLRKHQPAIQSRQYSLNFISGRNHVRIRSSSQCFSQVGREQNPSAEFIFYIGKLRSRFYIFRPNSR